MNRGLALALFGSGCVSLNLGYMDDAQARLEQSVVLWQQIGEPQWLSSSLQWLAYLVMQRGDGERAHTIYAEHESLFRTSSDPLVLAWTLGNWGGAKCAARPDDPTGKVLLDEALSFAHSLQDPFCFVLCYSSLGDWAVLQGDYATARRYFLKALEWRRQLGTRWIIVAGLWQVANIMCLQGDYSQAEPIYTEALALARALGDQRSEAHIAQELGAVAIHLGSIEYATILLAESLASFRKWADSLGIARCLMGFVHLRQVYEHMEQAACLLSFVDSWLHSNQIQLVHFDRTSYERSMAAARAQLDEATFAKAWAEGRTLTMEQVIELVTSDE